MIRHLLFATTGAIALAGCTVGPDYQAPLASAAAQAPFVEGGDPAFAPQEPPAEWWALFDAPVLDRLVDEALAANTDLRVAAANLEQARAVLGEVRSQRLPTTTVNGSASYQRIATAAFGQAGPGIETEIYDVGLDASYQIDLLGGIRRGIEAGRADVDAAQASYDLARISVVAETARAFADACGAGRQLAVARESVRLQQDIFDITSRVVEAGRGSDLELSQSSALLEQTRSTIPGLEAERKAALYRLAVLTGRPPAEFPADVAGCNIVPQVRSAIPVGDGASLLARRPDVRAAERRLASATARIGVATANLYPNISIGAGIGSTVTSADDLLSDKGLNFNIGPLISWSFPNIAASRARLRQAEAGADGALAQFDGAWLNALQETESALARYVAEQDRLAGLTRSAEQSARAAELAGLRYEAGADSFLNVLDAQRTLANAQAQQAASEAELASRTVGLFLSLGGGW